LRKKAKKAMSFKALWRVMLGIALSAALLSVGSCADTESEQLKPAILGTENAGPVYKIGPGDSLQISVWRNPELSVSVPVRPDGRISVPLIADLRAAGKTPTELANEISEGLSKYIQEPVVTVIVTGFVGPLTQQVRVVGEAVQPKAIPYRDNMTLLDVMIACGGLTNFANGNGARIIRMVDGAQKQFAVRLDDLLKDGDIAANVQMLPGDVLIIPQSLF